MFCPTQEMVSNFFTKPLQGALYARMRAKILNLPGSTSTTAHRSVLKEQKYDHEKNERKSMDCATGAGVDEQKIPGAHYMGLQGVIQDWFRRMLTVLENSLKLKS